MATLMEGFANLVGMSKDTHPNSCIGKKYLKTSFQICFEEVCDFQGLWWLHPAPMGRYMAREKHIFVSKTAQESNFLYKDLLFGYIHLLLFPF